MLRLTAELAVFLAVPIVLLRVGGFWATVTILFLFLVVFPVVIGHRFYAEFIALRNRRRSLQEERQRFAQEMRIFREARPAPGNSYTPDEEPQSGGS
jgi:hypothetical protein